MPASIDDLLHKLDDKQYLADIFLILHFDELQQPVAASLDRLELLVPQCIDELLINDSPDADAVLAALVTWARPDARALSESALALIVSDIRTRYGALRQYAFVRPIPDESDPDIAAVLNRLLPTRHKKAGVVHRMSELVRKSVTTILTNSKRTGTALLMRGRDFAKFIRDRVVQVELPSKADEIIKKKTAFTARLFAFKGGQAVRFFVGLSLGVAGCFTGAPAIVNLSGVALAFVDP